MPPLSPVAPSLSPNHSQDGAFYLDLQQPCRSTGYVCSHITAPGPGLPDSPLSHTLRSTLDPGLHEDSNAAEVPVGGGGAPDDGAGVLAMDCRAGPCQRFARNCATRNLTSPHEPTLGSAFHLLGCVGR
jgi:hypothetical protein